MRDLVYMSYSSHDVAFRDELRDVLLSDIRLRDLEWDDRKIPVGADWRLEIDQHVARARIMIMMVSETYLALTCKAWQFEIPQALEAHKNGELAILWVPVRKVAASATPFAHIHAALPPSQPLDSLNDAERETAYHQLKHEILNLLGLEEPSSFDVFLSHNSVDKPTVRRLGEALKKRGLTVWLDEWELIPGRQWQDALEEIITTCGAAIVCVGEKGIGPWEDPEMQALLRRFVKEKKRGTVIPVIPALLPSAPAEVKLPVFLEGFMWVDFRAGMTTDGLDRVQWGITGTKPKGRPKHHTNSAEPATEFPAAVKATPLSESEPLEAGKLGRSGRVIFGLHGIRTHAGWNRALYEVATEVGWQVRADRWNFGYFSVLQFLMPWARSAKVMWFREAYREETRDRNVLLNEGQHPSIVANSFGTYILGNALLKYDWLRFNKVILCGSILPVDFPWDKLIERGQVQSVRNEYGVQDVWSGLVQWFVAGTGPSGQAGFRCQHERLEQERFEYTHSEYFDKGHMEAKWLPFIGQNVTQISATHASVQRPRANRPWAMYAVYCLLLLGIAIILWEFVLHPSEPNGGGVPSISIYKPAIGNASPTARSRANESGDLLAPDSDGLPPPDPPEDIPSLAQSGLAQLTDNDRMKKEFSATTITIVNESSESIRLSYDYVPRISEEQDSTFAHRVTEVIPAHQTVDHSEINFGGPYHISVLAKGRWFPENVWVDLRVVSKRTIVVSKIGDGFQCTVRFEELIP